eukprot:4346494-Alexandrium_andersonii.AAC.1
MLYVTGLPSPTHSPTPGRLLPRDPWKGLRAGLDHVGGSAPRPLNSLLKGARRLQGSLRVAGPERPRG